MHSWTHKYTHTCWKMSVLLVSVPSSVPVCLVGLVSVCSAALCQAAICNCIWAVVMFLGWAPVNGSFAVVVFCRLSRVCILVAPSVYVGGNDCRGRGGGGFVACSCSYSGCFSRGVWLWLVQVGWRSFSCLFRLLKEYTRLVGGVGWNVPLSNNDTKVIHVTLIDPKSGCIQRQIICSVCCGNNKGVHFFSVSLWKLNWKKQATV